MFYAPVRHWEYTELEMPAPQVLGPKFRSANRGNPKTGRAVHQTKNLRLLTKGPFLNNLTIWLAGIGRAASLRIACVARHTARSAPSIELLSVFACLARSDG